MPDGELCVGGEESWAVSGLATRLLKQNVL